MIKNENDITLHNKWYIRQLTDSKFIVLYNEDRTYEVGICKGKMIFYYYRNIPKIVIKKFEIYCNTLCE